MSNNVQQNYGMGFAGLLTVFFIGLKLIGYISWSWLWVLSPLWITASISLAVIAIFFIIIAILHWMK